ncbi:MAG TPA: PRC-barrel domain-containing protein [Candidatus Krumholzibacteria bacterium]|nr:PRC-barrel domain-containing protein [Candidatus Krumholzibacteria bacterium]HRX52062.1 PRC-barrel domain-containing protein [Candidatus Krumholzibacteria bacterium]
MLRSLKEIKGYELEAVDGGIGRCADFLIDEQTWTVRWMVADTRRWLPGRRVVVSPIALGEPAWADSKLPVRLSREQVEAAPDLDEHAPVTREYEIWYHRHYGWPYYWGGGGLWASSLNPRALFLEAKPGDEDGPELDRPHLHSADEILGYDIAATDGAIGHVDDIILDDETWSVAYVVAATRNWLPGKRVLLSLADLEDVHWAEGSLAVRLTRDDVKESPAYDPSAPVNRELVARSFDFVGRPRGRD